MLKTVSRIEQVCQINKVRQKSVRKSERDYSNNRRSSNRKSNKLVNMSSNVYESSMSNKFLEMSSTPDNSKTRYASTKPSVSNSYMGLRKSYAGQMIPAENNIRMRQSESTKPVRNTKITGRTPSKLRNSKMRASSNPKLGTRELHNSSSASIKGRKGQLMSSSKLGKIINDQTNHLLEQKQRIKQIYNPSNELLMSSASNIKVTDEFPSIKSKNLTSANKAVKDDRNKSKRYSQLQNRTNDSGHNTEEWKGNQTHDQLSNSDIMHKVPEGLMSTDVGRRENIGVEDFARIDRNNVNSHSLLGNLSGAQHKLKKKLSKDNSTVPIKYDTTAVISEEFSNFEDPFTQMYTNSILSEGRI